jgi:hypothetical protein
VTLASPQPATSELTIEEAVSYLIEECMEGLVTLVTPELPEGHGISAITQAIVPLVRLAIPDKNKSSCLFHDQASTYF